MDAALAELDLSDTLNYATVAKKHNVHPSTLRRQFLKETRSKEDFLSDSKRLLTNAQETFLLNYIDRQSQRGLYLTPRILQNIVEEVLQRHINKNWAASFCKRHQYRITSRYLNGFDRARHVAESAENISHFFDNVSILDIIRCLNTDSFLAGSHNPQTSNISSKYMEF
jgi:hypothetical protein